jgi:hypothetical protein
MSVCRLYGVSSGNGNDGVSHMFADYYVYTDDPWRLAKLALVSGFKDEYKESALDVCEIDGESDYTIAAVIYDPLDEEPGEDDEESWCSVNGAWFIVEVFPEDDAREGRPLFYSLSHAFDSADLSLVTEESE